MRADRDTFGINPVAAEARHHASPAERDDETAHVVSRHSGDALAGGQVVGRSLRQNYKMLASSGAPHLSLFLQ
jgi:hypothetical protein